MKEYNMTKIYDLSLQKNVQEDETRNEITGVQYFDISNVSIKSIHNSKKDFK